MNRVPYIILVLTLTVGPLVLAADPGDGTYRPGQLGAGQSGLNLVPPAQQSTQFFTVEEGINLYRFEHGGGNSVALVLHGGPCAANPIPWKGLRGTPNVRFIYYHQRGCGESSKLIKELQGGSFFARMTELDQKLGLTTQLADIERIRRILGVDSLILIGHSFGGLLAILYAAEFPDRVDTLVLSSPANLIKLPTEGDLFKSIAQYLPNEKKAEYGQFLEDYFNYGKILFSPHAAAVELHRKFAEYYRLALETKLGKKVPYLHQPKKYPVAWMPFAVYFGLGSKHDYVDFLSRVNARAIVLHGVNDMQTQNISKAFASYLDSENTSFDIIPESSHFAFNENPKAFSEAVNRFLFE